VNNTSKPTSKPPKRKPHSTGTKSGKADTASARTRIAKAMADAGLCSRREAEAWIAAGRVSVNGVTLETPAITVGSNDRVLVDGKPLPARERSRLWLFHKPRGLVTTSADPQGRPTVFSVLPKTMPRVISVGRLDINTEGLLLLTNDGALARRLELPDTGWVRRYRVRVYGKPDRAKLESLAEGITVDGVRYGRIEAHLDRAKGDNSWLTLAFAEGKNREVRRVMEAIGLKVNRLLRHEYGPFKLGELLRGEVQEVSSTALREALGAELSGALRRGDKRLDSLINSMAQPNLPPKKPIKATTPEDAEGKGPDAKTKRARAKGPRPEGWAKAKPKPNARPNAGPNAKPKVKRTAADKNTASKGAPVSKGESGTRGSPRPKGGTGAGRRRTV
jgi:23S rRNA pseudouridine2605 synthase